MAQHRVPPALTPESGLCTSGRRAHSFQILYRDTVTAGGAAATSAQNGVQAVQRRVRSSYAPAESPLLLSDPRAARFSGLVAAEQGLHHRL